MAEKIQDVDPARAEIAAPRSGFDGRDKPDETCCATAPTSPAPGGPGEVRASALMKSGAIGSFWKLAACCGGMLLLLPALGLVSAGGLAAVAGSALSVAAVLVCPIGMYFMMRGMTKQAQHPGQIQRDGRGDRSQPPGDQTPPNADR